MLLQEDEQETVQIVKGYGGSRITTDLSAAIFLV